MSVEPTKKLNLKALWVDSSASEEVKHDSPQATIDIDQAISDTKEKEIITANDSKDTISNSEPTVTIQSESKPEEKSENAHRISFADIQKQITSPTTQETLQAKDIDNPSEDKKEDILSESITHPSDSKNNSPFKNSSSNSEEKNTPEAIQTGENDRDSNDHGNKEIELPKVKEAQIINTEASKSETPEKKEENKDVQILENANKAKQIMEEKNLKKKSKKKRFSFFRKKDKTQDKVKKGDDETDILETKKSNILIESQWEKEKEVNQEPKVKEEIHFSNYESHFKKESVNFLKRFQKFKYTPNTRVWMVLWLITITIICISALMVFFPERHSVEIYKASILEIAWKWEITPTQTPNIAPENNVQQEEEIKIEDDINIEDEGEVDNISETLPPEDILVEESTNIWKQEESKERLRQHLLNKYK